MIIIERLVQHIYLDKWAELETIDKEWNAVESKCGFPAKVRRRIIAGPDDQGTLIIERQWPSLAAMETAYEKLFAEPAYQVVSQKSGAVIRDNRMELYTPLP
jgi:hypothetical protein